MVQPALPPASSRRRPRTSARPRTFAAFIDFDLERPASDTHHLDATQRDQVIGMLLVFLDHALHSTRRRAESGHPGFAKMWADGYERMNRRSKTWLIDHARDLVDSDGGRPW